MELHANGKAVVPRLRAGVVLLLTMNALVSSLLFLHVTAPGAGAATTLFAWSTGAPSPLGLFEAQGAAVGGKLYVVGGFTTCCSTILATAKVHAYDPAANAWQPLADMPEAITHGGTAVDGQTIYVAGGFVGNHPGDSTAHVWKYDIAANRWSAAPALPAVRGGGALVRLGRELHFFGGV